MEIKPNISTYYYIERNHYKVSNLVIHSLLLKKGDAAFAPVLLNANRMRAFLK